MKKIVLYPHQKGLAEVQQEVALRLGWFDPSRIDFIRDIKNGPINKVVILNKKDDHFEISKPRLIEYKLPNFPFYGHRI